MTSADVLQAKTELLEAVAEAMTELLRVGDPRAASGRVLRAALQQTDSEYGFAGVMHSGVFRILNHEGMRWDDQVNRKFYEEALQRYEEDGYLEFTNLKNLFGEALLTRRPVISNSPVIDPRSGGLPTGHPPLRSFLGVPILNGEDVTGMIAVANRVDGYGEAEQYLIEVLAQMAGVIYDTYARQQREADLAQQLRQAQRMEAIGRLAGGVAHDFNNLLTVIAGFTDFVLHSIDETDTRRADLLEVHKAAERAATLTRQLLAFSRRQILQPRVLDLNALVSNVEKLLRRTIPENIDIVLELDPLVEPVRVDQNQFEQVLLNLSVNARDAMPDGGELILLTTCVDVDEKWSRRRPPMAPGRYVRLTVSDTGSGIPPEVQPRIFEPFFTTKERGKGTGLGLATVYGTIKQSNGFIWMTSEVGRGTTFAIYLPVVPEPIEPAILTQSADEIRGGPETILIAEDDGGVRRLSRAVLTNQGYTVLDARDGEEALTIARQHPGTIHLLVTDMVMPGVSGRELASQLTMTRPGMRVLYTSGYAENVTARVERRLPLLANPFLPADLLRKVREVLETGAFES